MDPSAVRARIRGVRRAVIALLVVVAVGLAAASAAGGDRSARRARAVAAAATSINRSARRVSLAAGLSVRVPAGWHLLRGWLSDVIDPAPRLALASFPAKLSRHTCACGFPNVIHFPRDGAFMFAWEYLHPQRGQLVRTPSRPARVSLTVSRAVRLTCDGPNDEAYFKEAGRVFQVEIYIGPTAGRALRAQVAAMLDSLRVAPARDA